MYYMLMMLNIILTFMFFMLNHPLSMGLMLLMQTLLISLMTSIMTYSYWFSYILFLIMIGGMLILFIYMTSLASNEMFNFSNKYFTLMIMMLMLIFMLLLLDYLMILPNMKNSSLLNFFFNLNYKNENLNALNMIYNLPNNLITFMLMNYLFLTLVAVVKITNFNKGPLRQKF